MTFGQRLEIANGTTILFAPALEEQDSPALHVAPPRSDAVKLYPRKPGHYTLVDRLNGHFLRADVYVFLHPLHTANRCRRSLSNRGRSRWQNEGECSTGGDLT